MNESPEDKAKRIGVLLIPSRPQQRKENLQGVIAICGECGLEIYRSMGYCCPKQNCPTGLGGYATL